MPIFSFAVLIIVGIVITVVKVTSQKKRKEEQERREQEKRDEQIREMKKRVQENNKQKRTPQAQTQSASQRSQSSPPKRDNASRDPFPTYIVNPFDEQITYAASMSAAQLNEWMLDFAAAEKAGAARPEVGKIKPLFARYLYESGFNYRLLRKISGYTPQNRLQFNASVNKIKPAFSAPTVSNGHIELPLPDRKSPPSAAYVRQKGATVELPKKNFKERRELYESFYVNRD